MCTEMQNTTPSSHPKALFTSQDAIAVAHCCFSKRKTQGRFYFNFGLIQVRIKIREQIQCKNGKSKEDNVLVPTCSQQKQHPLSVPLKPSPSPPSPPSWSAFLCRKSFAHLYKSPAHRFGHRLLSPSPVSPISPFLKPLSGRLNQFVCWFDSLAALPRGRHAVIREIRVLSRYFCGSPRTQEMGWWNFVVYDNERYVVVTSNSSLVFIHTLPKW